MKLTADKIYQMLIEDDKILTLTGQIRFYLGDVNIIVRQKDVVGNIIQEWLQGWLDQHKIEYAPSENTQMPPDFFLDPEDKTSNLLEVKAFNREKSPGFDIADFRMYEEEIIEKPYMLHVDYLIFGYNMSSDGIVTIKDLWLKKVWQITCSSADWALKLQVKEKVVNKIRPCVWYGRNRFPAFETMEDFVSAIEETVYQDTRTHNQFSLWRKRFTESYNRFYGTDITIPKWDHIKTKYNPPTKAKSKS